MIKGKHGKFITELSEGRSEITTQTICDAERLYFIRRRTLVDSPNGLVKPKKDYTLSSHTVCDAHTEYNRFMERYDQRMAAQQQVGYFDRYKQPLYQPQVGTSFQGLVGSLLGGV